ncbi:MAG: hypothetical protein LQ343_007894 [Gyalolechia ehrenbergii]|nr:MAG: hypothetical protein LQ343_007894 [Gyalolechia ehrenbergii]
MAAAVEPLRMGSISQPQQGRKRMFRYTTRPPLREPEFEMMKPTGDVHELVIAIEETHPDTFDPIPSPPKARTSPFQDATAPSFRLEAPTPPQADGPTTPISLILSCPSTSPPGSRSVSPVSSDPSPSSHIGSPNLDRKGSTASTGTYSPVMRSMFPRYDPALSLRQQRYYPSTEISPAVAATSSRVNNAGSYSASLYTQLEAPSVGRETALPSGLGLQNAGKLSEKLEGLSGFSTPVELVNFWALANGQMSKKAAKEYRLELNCDDLEAGQEIIRFDSSTSQSLYTLSASGTDVLISRSHPTNDTTTIQVSTPTLQRPNSSTAVIATIFPKLAELMAIDKSSSVAVEHRLDRKECTALQTEAVERAHYQEASNLLWDSESQKYYLIHPTLLADNSPAAFPIELSSNAGTPREIKILAPSSAIPLLVLSFETMLLNIHTNALSSYSSLYLLDILLSATLVLLLHLHRSRSSPPLRPTSPAASAIPYFEPPPTFPSPLQSKKTKKERRLTSWSRSFFARDKKRDSHRSGDNEETATVVTIQDSPSSDHSITAKLPHPPKNNFQVIDPANEKLPRPTRAVLKILYWGFECLVWALGMLVNLLAMMVVGLGKLVKVL